LVSIKMESPWTSSPEEILKVVGADFAQGLPTAKVAENRAKYGSNENPPEERTPFWKLVLEQFDDMLVKILVGAAVISFVLAIFEDKESKITAFAEPAVICLILIANATVGVLQEQKAEAAIEALKAYEADKANVLRDGKVQTIPAEELVCGDIVQLSDGDQIPADLRFVKQVSISPLQVDQSILTGESVTVGKDVHALAPNKATVIQDKTNMLFKGTNITRGKGIGCVVATGPRTEIGKIRSQLAKQEEDPSPLQKKLDIFGEQLSKVIAVICIIVWVININHFSDPEHGSFVRGAIYYFNIAVALAVAAIPEGLPAVVTTCLALGSQKMAKRNALVRHLPSVETLGCTTVICSDKTGTLTTNKMQVSKVIYVDKDASVRELDVTGSEWRPEGELKLDGATLSKPYALSALSNIATIGSLCNDAHIEYKDSTKSYERVGEPREAAIKALVEKIGAPGINQASLDPEGRAAASCRYYTSQYKREATLEFTRAGGRNSMSVLVQKNGEWQFLVKGAPESILNRCTNVLLNSEDGKENVVPLTPKHAESIKAGLLKLASSQLTCLAFARVAAKPKNQYDLTNPDTWMTFEANMTFCGIIGMYDPPRREVPDAIKTCRSAGIRVIVITGDIKPTAESICRKIGIFGADEDLRGKSFTGPEFDQLSEADQLKAVRNASLFSRTEPTHKSKLVALLRKQNEVVAMTGDGVNDAPALKAADIGVAMGSGTAVAKSASRMVLADDNFATIVGAVEQGRAIYNNTKQFIRYLISSNIGEVVCIFLTAALGMPEALVPVQLLWVNLVTDGLPATALGFNPAESDLMKRSPRGKDDPIINGWTFLRYIIIGTYVGFATVGGFGYWFMYYENGPKLSWSQLVAHSRCTGNVAGTTVSCSVFNDYIPATIALSVLVTIEMFNALNSVSENQSMLTMPPFVNMWLIGAVMLSFALHFAILYIPFFASVFGAAPLGWGEWKIVLAFSAPVIVIDEVLKFFSRLLKPDQKFKKD